LAQVQPVALVIPPETAAIPLASASAPHEPAALPPLPAAHATDDAVLDLGATDALAPDLTVVSFSDPFQDLQSQSALVEFASAEAFGEAPLPGQAPAGEATGLRALAEGFVADWQAPEQAAPEVALFVAADDEALSWSLSQSGPNHGAVAYRDDQVELGRLAVGVSMSVGDIQLSAAYIEREINSHLIGANGVDESYAGLTFTYQN